MRHIVGVLVGLIACSFYIGRDYLVEGLDGGGGGNDFQGNEDFLGWLLEPGKSEERVHLTKFSISMEAKDYASAMDHVNHLLVFDPNNEEYLLYKGTVYYLTKDYKDALKYFLLYDKNSAARQKDATFYFNFALTYFYNSDSNTCLSMIQKAIDLNPSFDRIPRVHKLAGLAYYVLADMNKSFDSFSKSYNLVKESESPSNMDIGESLSYLIEVLIRQGKMNDSLKQSKYDEAHLLLKELSKFKEYERVVNNFYSDMNYA